MTATADAGDNRLGQRRLGHEDAHQAKGACHEIADGHGLRRLPVAGPARG